MLNVFCVMVGDKYDISYVNALRFMFNKNLKIPFRFVCATDMVNEEIQFADIFFTPPRMKCWGWWNLQEAYSNPAWANGGPVLYAGLDTVITGDITSVIEERIVANKLTLHRDFSHLVSNSNALFNDTWADGITFIPVGGVPVLWDSFKKDIDENNKFPMHVYNTGVLRENNITPDLWDDVSPGFICSYKWPEEKKEKPAEPVVLFHGDPKPHQAATNGAGWIIDAVSEAL